MPASLALAVFFRLCQQCTLLSQTILRFLFPDGLSHQTVSAHVRGVVGCWLLLSLTACGGGGGGSSSSGGGANDDSAVVEENTLSNISPYSQDSPYAAILKSCVMAETSDQTCLLADLPLLWVDAPQPSVDDIMNRVVVSHSWMGLRFRQALETMPQQLLTLFSAVTAIVIDDDIRPSSYQPALSTIYLDPAHLWLTTAEQAVISKEEDYRSDFADGLAFVSLARFVEGNDYAWDFYSLDDDVERTIADIRLDLARLLLHELMHANDFFPPLEVPYLAATDTIYQAYEQLLAEKISTALDSALPLQSQLMKDLAAVMYLGETATQLQLQLGAEEVGEAMEFDGASDDYGYSSLEEDVAMLFSESMMKYFFDINRDIAYTNNPGDSADCEDYVVAWGVRGRIGDSVVKQRAQYVVSEVYPDDEYSLFFQDLSLPVMMRVGEDWCDNIVF